MNNNSLILNSVFVASVLACVIGNSAANAALIAYDGFAAPGDYSTSGKLPGQNPALTGWTGAWKNGSSTTDTASTVSSTGLIYGAVTTTPGSMFQNGNARVGRQLASGFDSSYAGTVYLSLMIQDVSTGGNNWGLEAYNNGPGVPDYTSMRTLQLGYDNGNGGGTGNYMLRINNNNSLGVNLGALDTHVNYFVVKFTFSAANNGDSLTVWRNPNDLSSESASGAGQTLSGFNLTFDNLGAGQYQDTNGAYLDELRLGTTWTDVTTVSTPEPASLSLLALGGLTLLTRRPRAGHSR